MQQALRRTVAAAILLTTSLSWAGESRMLWEIGKADGNNVEFALAPSGFGGYRDDGLFIVGRSDAKKDWPYVQPGPSDTWAGGRAHTFTVVFGVKEKPSAGACRLLVDLLDTHSKSPPKLKIEVNGQPFELPLPRGAGDDSIRGEAAKGKPHHATVQFPATLLRAGKNEITLITISGSWLLYDRVALETPAGVETEPVASGTAIMAAEVSPLPVEHDGKRCHRITLTLAHSGDIANAVVRLDDATEQFARRMLPLTAGRHTMELFVPAVSKARYATLALTIAGETLDSRPLTLVPGVEQVVIVFKTHFDIGYTEMASNVVQRYRTTMIDQALAVVDQNRDLPPAQQFAWTIPGWPMHQILDWPEQTPERKARVERALKDGRFVLHALPFTLHTETLELEDLVRGLGHSSRISQRLGLPLPRDAKMTDVPCHAWIMPTLLRHAGVNFLHLGCNSASSSPRVPPLFWWEGADGSRVLTMYSAGGYGTGLVPPADWPHRTWLALIHTGDNHGPPTPDEVKKLLDQAARKLPGVKVRIGRLSDFADALVAEKPELAVVRGDMPDSWIHGPMCDPLGAKLARNIRPAIATAETLGTQLDAWKVKRPATASAVSAAYEQSLLYGEHTWGAALWWLVKYEGGAKFGYGDAWRAVRDKGHFKRHEESWAEHTAYIEKARDLTAPLLDHELRALAQAVGGNGKRIVVFNPLPWKRSGPVVASLRDAPPSVAALKPADGGDAVPVETAGGELRFVARDVPPLGYRVFMPVKAELPPTTLRADEKTATIESPSFKATLDPARGAIRSLTDKRTGRELVEATAAQGFGQYLYERFDSNSVAAYVSAYVKGRSAWAVDQLGKPALPSSSEVPYRAASPRNCKLSFAQTPVSVSAAMTSAARPDLPHAVTTRLILYADAPWADLEVTLHDKPADPWPEAGWICLPFKIASPRFRVGRPGSIIDPARDIIAGANHDLYSVTTGVAMLDAQDRGVGFCAPDTPLLSLGRPGGWKYDPEFVPQKATAFVNLFNNQWTTNFRFWNEGTWTVRVRFWAFDHFEAQAGLITPSLEAREPLLAAVADGSAGKLPPTQRGLELSRRGVQVTAFGDNPDGAGTVLRLWELAGESGPCRVTLLAGLNMRSVQPVSLRGVPTGSPVAIKDGAFTINLKAFAPASFVLKQ